MGSNVDAMKKMSMTLENELTSLLTFFGEKTGTPEAPKPEDFFGMILSFSSSLQVRLYRIFLGAKLMTCCYLPTESSVRGRWCRTETCSLQAQAYRGDSTRGSNHRTCKCPSFNVGISVSFVFQTVKAPPDSLGQKQTLKPPDSQGRAGEGSRKGALDQAIRSVRNGNRRARPRQALSKIFVDGTRTSRAFD